MGKKAAATVEEPVLIVQHVVKSRKDKIEAVVIESLIPNVAKVSKSNDGMQKSVKTKKRKADAEENDVEKSIEICALDSPNGEEVLFYEWMYVCS